MKNLFILFVLSFTVFFTYTVVAQEFGSLKRGYEITIPEKIQGPFGDPLPSGTYTIGTGGDFPSIDSAFNKLSIDGITGEVTIELIDNLYTAPTDTFGFLLVGPIAGAGDNSRVIIKPAQNQQVTIEGNGGAVLSFLNTSYVTVDGVTLRGGSTSLTIHSYQNSQYTWNDGLNFLDDSDHNIVTTILFNCEDYSRPCNAIGFWMLSGTSVAPDSNIVKNNDILQAGLAIYVSAYFSNIYAYDNIIKDNFIFARPGFNIDWGIQLEKNENSIIENNYVRGIRNSIPNFVITHGINAYWCNSTLIRNNLVWDISSNITRGSTGILLSGDVSNVGSDNMVYNNMIFDIQSTSSDPMSRVAGINMWYQNNPKFYYNTIYLSGEGTNIYGSGALMISGNTYDIDSRNNILVNTRNESPYCASSIYDKFASGLTTSDYNDLYYEAGQNNCLVRIGGNDYLTLQDWQTTGNDVSSITELPNFIDFNSDLHIDETIPTHLESGAIPISGIDTDFDGDLRHTIAPDIGADEFDGIGIDTLYVPADYSTIQEAIDAAIDGNTILVADGTYYENINYKGKAITVASHFLIAGDVTHIDNTIINGSQPSHPDSGSVVYFISGEDTTSILCGFTITGGTGTGPGPNNGSKVGGGIYSHNAGAKIKFNKINLNTSFGYPVSGGGIYSDADSTQYWILIENNFITNNYMMGNRSSARGGGIYIEKMYGKICNNIIRANGGGSFSTLGGAICIDDCSPFIVNNTIVDNSAYTAGGYLSVGGIAVNAGQPIIMNNIIWNNTGTEEISENANVYFCNVEGGYVGVGNINIYPEFVDSANGDYHLSDNSPCINTGIDSLEVGGFWYYCPVTDLEGNPRPNPSGSMPDMGAYEFGLPVGVEDELLLIPDVYSLSQNYPNPFNPSTKIRYSIPQSSKIIIKVFDILGNEIETLVNEEKPAGTYELTWNAENLPSGVYFYRIQAGSFIETKKMILMK